jgi:hypothetical protein
MRQTTTGVAVRARTPRAGYRLGVPDVVIQRILRHANVSTTTGYYIKSAADDVCNAMTKLENSIPKPELDTNWTPTSSPSKPI